MNTEKRFRLRPALVPCKRNLIKLTRTPEQLIDVTLQPIIFLVLFLFVFGGAIAHGSRHDYLEFLLPGLIGQTIAMSSISIGQNMNADIAKGVFDRFRSLPIARSVPLVGAVLADFFRYLLLCVILVGFGYALGFRITTNPMLLLAALGISICFALAFAWVSLWVGMTVPSTRSRTSSARCAACCSAARSRRRSAGRSRGSPGCSWCSSRWRCAGTSGGPSRVRLGQGARSRPAGQLPGRTRSKPPGARGPDARDQTARGAAQRPPGAGAPRRRRPTWPRTPPTRPRRCPGPWATPPTPRSTGRPRTAHGLGQVTAPGGDLGQPQLDLRQVLAVPDFREQVAGLGKRRDRAVQVAVKHLDVADGPQCHGQAPPFAERAEGVQRLDGGDAHLVEVPVVFRHARGHQPGRRA
jgi:hypothetical protein